MTTPPDITVAELRTAIGRVLDAVEEQFGEELRFPVDYYWAIPVEDAYATYDTPKLEMMGQVSDDTASVRAFLDEPTDEYVSIVHECAHLRGVLQAIEHLDLNPVPPATEPGDTDTHTISCHRRRRWWRPSRR
ncbi:hypothetical protein [Nocardioides massiliensis]|uniref:Uncharacterized protein n=1 Tax=Nocardioides massiliensis TaxID=1325935 RepID=A0ABT9NRA4_9ACTN|nr:hypothetical protein [Nocardioides massiliensis]MDP9822841.1 hypothetical protein [Nocardioides massiliensis]